MDFRHLICATAKYKYCMKVSVHSKDYQLGPIRQNLNYFRGSLSQNFQFLLKKGLIYQEKAYFLHNVTKSVEPIFQGLEPIVRHRALKGTLMKVIDLNINLL